MAGYTCLPGGPERHELVPAPRRPEKIEAASANPPAKPLFPAPGGSTVPGRGGVCHLLVNLLLLFDCPHSIQDWAVLTVLKHFIWLNCRHKAPLKSCLHPHFVPFLIGALTLDWCGAIGQSSVGFKQLANENAMLWVSGLIEHPYYQPVEGPDSCEVTGIFARGWPVRLTPSHRLAIGVRATCQDGRIKKYAVALTAGCWQEGSWQIIGTRTTLAPGHATEARAWFFGCWRLLQAVLGKDQVNIPNRAGWAAIQKGAKGTAAPDLWHNF